ncbi:hypothetical protein EQG49_13380 [Periweissella cryptocerci]|uniref:Uncharacterized protein n=1 Tax=Periweissella cryptocerci TaxID=2506420 RepID=A0A4P6YWV1_9LACO|nr:hypothetical protein [Periweissella cryptocerci]QBO37389.1 hypothetical protein EQG49_13380 [Periweissella cryptocerci]
MAESNYLKEELQLKENVNYLFEVKNGDGVKNVDPVKFPDGTTVSLALVDYNQLNVAEQELASENNSSIAYSDDKYLLVAIYDNANHEVFHNAPIVINREVVNTFLDVYKPEIDKVRGVVNVPNTLIFDKDGKLTSDYEHAVNTMLESIHALPRNESTKVNIARKLADDVENYGGMQRSYGVIDAALNAANVINAGKSWGDISASELVGMRTNYDNSQVLKRDEIESAYNSLNIALEDHDGKLDGLRLSKEEQILRDAGLFFDDGIGSILKSPQTDSVWQIYTDSTDDVPNRVYYSPLAFSSQDDVPLEVIGDDSDNLKIITKKDIQEAAAMAIETLSDRDRVYIGADNRAELSMHYLAGLSTSEVTDDLSDLAWSSSIDNGFKDVLTQFDNNDFVDTVISAGKRKLNDSAMAQKYRIGYYPVTEGRLSEDLNYIKVSGQQIHDYIKFNNNFGKLETVYDVLYDLPFDGYRTMNQWYTDMVASSEGAIKPVRVKDITDDFSSAKLDAFANVIPGFDRSEYETDVWQTLYGVSDEDNSRVKVIRRTVWNKGDIKGFQETYDNVSELLEMDSFKPSLDAEQAVLGENSDAKAHLIALDVNVAAEELGEELFEGDEGLLNIVSPLQKKYSDVDFSDLDFSAILKQLDSGSFPIGTNREGDNFFLKFDEDGMDQDVIAIVDKNGDFAVQTVNSPYGDVGYPMNVRSDIHDEIASEYDEDTLYQDKNSDIKNLIYYDWMNTAKELANANNIGIQEQTISELAKIDSQKNVSDVEKSDISGQLNSASSMAEALYDGSVIEILNSESGLRTQLRLSADSRLNAKQQGRQFSGLYDVDGEDNYVVSCDYRTDSSGVWQHGYNNVWSSSLSRDDFVSDSIQADGFISDLVGSDSYDLALSSLVIKDIGLSDSNWKQDLVNMHMINQHSALLVDNSKSFEKIRSNAGMYLKSHVKIEPMQTVGRQVSEIAEMVTDLRINIDSVTGHIVVAFAPELEFDSFEELISSDKFAKYVAESVVDEECKSYFDKNGLSNDVDVDSEHYADFIEYKKSCLVSIPQLSMNNADLKNMFNIPTTNDNEKIQTVENVIGNSDCSKIIEKKIEAMNELPVYTFDQHNNEYISEKLGDLLSGNGYSLSVADKDGQCVLKLSNELEEDSTETYHDNVVDMLSEIAGQDSEDYIGIDMFRQFNFSGITNDFGNPDVTSSMLEKAQETAFVPYRSQYDEVQFVYFDSELDKPQVVVFDLNEIARFKRYFDDKSPNIKTFIDEVKESNDSIVNILAWSSKWNGIAISGHDIDSADSLKKQLDVVYNELPGLDKTMFLIDEDTFNPINGIPVPKIYREIDGQYEQYLSVEDMVLHDDMIQKSIINHQVEIDKPFNDLVEKVQTEYKNVVVGNSAATLALENGQQFYVEQNFPNGTKAVVTLIPYENLSNDEKKLVKGKEDELIGKTVIYGSHGDVIATTPTVPLTKDLVDGYYANMLSYLETNTGYKSYPVGDMLQEKIADVRKHIIPSVGTVEDIDKKVIVTDKHLDDSGDKLNRNGIKGR